MVRSQIRFDGKGTFDEWGLTLSAIESETPRAKTDYLPIAGRRGSSTGPRRSRAASATRRAT